MPYYTFIRDDGVTEDVFRHMDDPKVYDGENGDEAGRWKRVFTVPQMSLDTHLDPFDKNAFISTQRFKKETVGSTIDRSAELSAQRAALRGGVDPVKQKALNDYAAKRHGKRHPSELKQGVANAQKELAKLGLKIDLTPPKSRRLTG